MHESNVDLEWSWSKCLSIQQKTDRVVSYNLQSEMKHSGLEIEIKSYLKMPSLIVSPQWALGMKKYYNYFYQGLLCPRFGKNNFF